MLRCPKCKCIYNDETQKFCTGDGIRLLGLDQAIDEMPKAVSSRRTPPGELLFRTFVSPPQNTSVKKVAPLKGKPSYQMFGLHSSNTSDATGEMSATNGFHSFDYLVVKNNETKVGHSDSAPTLNEISEGNSTYGAQSAEKRKFGPSFILFCLLSALIFLTCLAFLANYIFREQSLAPAPSTRETSAATNLVAKKTSRSL